MSFIIRYPASDPARGWSYVLSMHDVYIAVVEQEAAHQFDTPASARDALVEMMGYPANRRRIYRLIKAEAGPVDREGFPVPDTQPIPLFPPWS